MSCDCPLILPLSVPDSGGLLIFIFFSIKKRSIKCVSAFAVR